LSVQITIPLEKIEASAGVAAALSALMAALHAKPASRSTPRPQVPAPASVRSAPATNPVAPASKPAVARATAAFPASVTTSPSQPTAPLAKAMKRRARAAGKPTGAAPPAAPATFSAGGPGPKLVALLRERGSLTAAAVAKELGIKDPKAIGGVVGSMNRWAGKKAGAVKIEVKDGKDGRKTYSLAK